MTMTTGPQTIQNEAPSNYYLLNKTSQQWQNWSVSLISLQTWYLVPVGIIGVVASVALRLIEGTFMLLVNACLAIKYLFVPPISQPPVQEIVPTPPVGGAIAPPPPQIPVEPVRLNPPMIHPQPLNPAVAPQPPILPRVISAPLIAPQLAPLNPPPPQSPQHQPRGCTTRVQTRARTQIAALKANPKPAITVATGLLAAGATLAAPSILPFAFCAVTGKLAWDTLTRKENNA